MVQVRSNPISYLMPHKSLDMDLHGEVSSPCWKKSADNSDLSVSE